MWLMIFKAFCILQHCEHLHTSVSTLFHYELLWGFFFFLYIASRKSWTAHPSQRQSPRRASGFFSVIVQDETQYHLLASSRNTVHTHPAYTVHVSAPGIYENTLSRSGDGDQIKLPRDNFIRLIAVSPVNSQQRCSDVHRKRTLFMLSFSGNLIAGIKHLGEFFTVLVRCLCATQPHMFY